MSADELAAAVEEFGAFPMPVLVGPEPLSAERLAEIRDRAGIATEGPWRVVEGHEIHQGAEFGDFAVYVAQTDPDCGCVQSVADAEFIAHAREDVPALLADNDRLRARVAELEAQRERRRVRLVALQNDALSMRGSLSPMGEDRKVPFPLGETLTPAVDWLIGRVAELEALTPARVQTCRVCGAGYTYGEPCSNCEFRKRMAAELQVRGLDGEHYPFAHHEYRVSHDLPETGGVSAPQTATVCRCNEPDADPYACEADDCTAEFPELNPFGGGPVEGRDAKVSRTCGCGWSTSLWHVDDGSAEAELHGHVVRVHGGTYPARTGGGS